jgi:surface antigen
MGLRLALGTIVLGLAITASAAASQQAGEVEVLTPALGALDAEMSLSDRQDLEAAFQHSLETMVSGQAHRWRAAQGSASASLTPLRTFRSASGHFCREYQARIETKLRRAELHGIACRSEDALWLKP